MGFSGNEDVDLAKYQCARCGKNPETSQEVFRGCQCGHRLFRIIPNASNSLRYQELNPKPKNHEDMEFLTVRERCIGVYDINVGQLMPKDSKLNKSPLIAGNEGVFTIQLDSSKKKK